MVSVALSCIHNPIAVLPSFCMDVKNIFKTQKRVHGEIYLRNPALNKAQCVSLVQDISEPGVYI